MDGGPLVPKLTSPKTIPDHWIMERCDEIKRQLMIGWESDCRSKRPFCRYTRYKLARVLCRKKLSRPGNPAQIVRLMMTHRGVHLEVEYPRLGQAFTLHMFLE